MYSYNYQPIDFVKTYNKIDINGVYHTAIVKVVSRGKY
jgi:hypothetical protein